MEVEHPLLAPEVKSTIESAASRYLGRPWTSGAFTDLDHRASHPSGILHGQPFSVFAKLSLDSDAVEKFRAELSGLTFLGGRAGIATPTPIGDGLVACDHGWLLLFVALAERSPDDRTADDWRSIGHTLAALHQVHDVRFGLEDLNGFFGPLAQDNRPVQPNRWADFYVERRVVPFFRYAVDSGHLPADLAAGVERLVPRMPDLFGPEPQPTLLHGDAQLNNFVITDTATVAVDVAPYFGHPEVDLALVDWIQPVHNDVFDAYREVTPIEPGFSQRRELWRIVAYLAGVAATGASPFGRRMLVSLAEAVRTYQ